MNSRPLTPRCASTLAPLLVAALAGCQRGGQSGDLNQDALDRKHAAPEDDGHGEPEPTVADGGRQTQAEPTADVAEPEPTAATPEPVSEPHDAGEPADDNDARTVNPSQPGTMTGPTPAPSSPMPTLPALDAGTPCTNVDYDSISVDLETLDFAGVTAVAVYGDETTSVCATTSPGKLCLEGVAPPAGSNYEHWGVGVAFVVESPAGEARDMVELGISAVGFELSDLAGRPARVAIAELDDPAIADPVQNFEANSFYWGGTNATPVEHDSSLTIAFTQFELPSWTLLVDPETGATAKGTLDASRIHSVRVELPNAQSDPTVTYGFCVSHLEWRGADGATVDLPRSTGAEDAGLPSTR